MQLERTAPAWRDMYDDRHRMVAAANYNTDVGDAWEFADVPYYPEPMTALAYRYGINYIVYSMTHWRELGERRFRFIRSLNTP